MLFRSAMRRVLGQAQAGSAPLAPRTPASPLSRLRACAQLALGQPEPHVVLGVLACFDALSDSPQDAPLWAAVATQLTQPDQAPGAD